MAVSALPAARAVRTACFTEQMEQKKAVTYHPQSEKLRPSFSFTPADDFD
jgi:hypothetical protein